MALLYRFTNTDQSVDVQYLFDAYDGHKRLVITEARGVSEQEIMLGFLFETGIQYWHDDFTTFAEQKHYNLDIYDNGEYKGRAVEGGFILSISLDDILGGTTSPEPGQHIIVPNTEQEITSIPNSGYRHNKFTVDGQDDTNNPITVLMDAAKSVVAFFTKTWNLTISQTGNGTVVPAVGVHVYDDEEEVTITATETDNDYYFNRFIETGQPDVTTNPYTITINENRSIQAEFLQLTQIFNVFSNIPQSIGGKWYFKNTEEVLNKYNQYVTCFGNSITNGNYPIYLRNYLGTKLNLPYRYTLYQNGVNGRTGAQMVLDYPIQVAPTYNSSGDNLLILMEIINDMSTYTYTEAYQHLIDITNLAHADGFKVLILTATPTVTAIPNYIQNANALILSNTVSDYVFDLSTIPETLDPNNLTYYSDGVHWTNTLSTIIANAIGAYIDSINYPNHVQVKKSHVATFNDTKLNVGRFHADYPSFEIILKIPNYVTSSGYIYSKRLSAGSDVEIQMSYGSSGVLNCFITTATGTLITATLSNKIISDKWTRIKFDTVGNNLHLSVFNVEQQQDYYEHIVPFTGVVKNVAADNVIGLRDYDNTAPMVNVQVAYFNINNGEFECFLNHKNGLNAYDKNGLITGTFSRTTTQLWNNTAEFVEPYFATKGTTIYTANSNPSDTSLWLFISGNETSQSISNYTKLGYFATNSGALKGLLNEYTVPTNTDIQAAGLAAGDHNFAYFDGLIQTNYLRITKTSNNISSILIKN